jgi:hypothetical protein
MRTLHEAIRDSNLCSISVEAAVREELAVANAEVARLQAIVDRLRDALQDLMDWQNGPPLITWTEKWNRAMDSMRSTQAEYNLKTSLMDIEQRMELDPDKNNSKKYLQEVDDAYNKSGAADTKSKLELDLVRQAMNYKVIGTFKNKQIDSDRANTAEMIALEVANPTPYSETYIQDLLAEKT